ncbi:ABC transporter permease subunit [Jatrophihabitans sp. DSM 45814]
MTAVATPVRQETAPAPEQPKAKWTDSLLLTALSILLALLLGGLLIVFSDDQVRTDLGYFFQSPGDFFSDAWFTLRDAYIALFEGAIFDPSHASTLTQALTPIMGSIYTATPLILGGLGVAIAFRAGLFNIGGEGQVIVGAFCSGYVGFAVSLPPVIHLILAIAAGIAGGAFWGFIAGFLKARAGAHEVITTIMLNYIARFGLLYLLARPSIVAPNNPQASKPIHGSARLPHLFGSDLRVDLGILLALAAAAALSWTLVRSTIGFQMRAVGANPAASRTAGMSVGGITMLAMAIGGGLAGLAGTTLSLGGATSYAVTPNISSNIGFDAITVALLGRNRPWGVVAAGLLFGALRQGGAQMQATPGVAAPIDIITVIQALIVIFIAAPKLVQAVFRLKRLGRSTLHTATTNLAVVVDTARVPRVARNVMSGSIMIVLGVLSLWLLGFSDRVSGKALFQFSLPGAKYDLGSWGPTAQPVVIVLSVLVILAGIARLTQVVAAKWCSVVAIVGLVVAVIFWSVAGSPDGLNVVSLLQGSVFLAVPLTLGALAGVIGERSGVVNVAIEGQLLLGAFVTAVVATVASSIWLGVLGGMIAGLALGAVLAVLAIRYLVDQVIIGVVLNVLALGLTSFLFNKLLSPHASEFNEPGYFKIYKIPILGDIPVIGSVLFSGTIFLYATYLLVIGVSFGLFHTRWGLRVRSVGEHPRAADTVGINVRRTRYRAVLLAGLIAGLGGAYLVIGSGAPGTFGLNMSNGKGFIALAAVIFGRWSPKGAVLAALLFGFADQLQTLLAQAGAPIDPSLLLMLPYLATLLAVAGFVGRVQPPAADGQPYSGG